MRELLLPRRALLIVFSLWVGAGGCAYHRARLTVREPRAPRAAHPLALHHVFQGALFEAMGDPASALIEYQEALLYDSTSSAIYQAVAENYLRLRKLTSAVRMLERAVELDSENTEALRLLSDLYQHARKYDRVEWALRRLLACEPDDPDVLRNLVALLVAQGRVAEAIETVRAASEKVPFGAEDFLGIAEVFARQGAMDQARWLVQQAIHVDPDNESAYMEMANLQIEAGDTVGAQVLLERAIAQHPDFREARRRLHDVYVMQGNWHAAIQLLEQEIAEDSTDLDVWLQLGRLYVQHGDTARAESLFTELVSRFPDRSSPYISLAALHVARGDSAAAIEVLRRGLERAWDDELADRARDLLIRTKRSSEALDLLQKWVARDSTRIPPRLYLADLYLAVGDTAEAEWELRRLVVSFPQDWRGYFALGRLFYLRSMWGEALRYLERARQQESDFVGTWILCGIAYLRQDSLSQAEAIFREAASRFPNEAQLHFLLGNTLMRQRRPQEAVEFFEKASRLDPDDEDFLLGLAAAYDELRQYDRSDSLYRRLLERNPDHPTALNNYAYSLSLRGERLEEAFQMAHEALLAEPRNGAFLDTMGWILYRMGRYGEALEYIRKASELRSDSPEVFEHLGEVLEKLGNLEQARQAWQRALELDPTRRHLMEKIEGR
ncbi:MAG: tetratricopeptide repeat protein [candidate division KSB1 bacterium]|nr:tetratricopeptide repeat protein [candidate division KSB1 bacterium]